MAARKVNVIRVAIGVVVAALVVLIGLRWKAARASTPTRITMAPAETPPPAVSSPPLLGRNSHYRPGAYLAIDDALHASARAARAGRWDEAAAQLDSDLAGRVGIVGERYVAARIGARQAPLDVDNATSLGLSLFDASYATGIVGARGIRIGRVLVDTNGATSTAFTSNDAYASFGLLRVLSLMEPWIRVWQDVGGVRPISELTPLYLATKGSGLGWSDIDVVATMHDLGLKVPPVLARDARFPFWAGFEDWMSKRLSP